MPHSIRYAFTATAGKPDLGNFMKKTMRDRSLKRERMHLPRNVMKAVEGLSTAKAKAIAKKLQESEKVAKSALQRTWATLLGIGPALRAVAPMSRGEWAKKLTHWKNEFISTLQHYWLGA